MSIRRQPLITGQMYHIYNRGVDKRDIFADKSDIYRFIESIKEFNREDKINSLANLRKSKLTNSNPQIEALPLSENLGGLWVNYNILSYYFFLFYLYLI